MRIAVLSALTRTSNLRRRGAAACVLLLLCLPACEERTDPVAPVVVTPTPAPTPAGPPGVVPTSPSPLLLACQAQPRQGDAPLTVSFRSFPSGGTGTYAFEWRFGDGGASTQPHPRHTYLSGGSFAATLLVSSGDQTAFCERSITVTGRAAPAPAPPSPGASPRPNPTPLPDLVITIAGDLGASSYSPNPADARVGQRVIWRNADVMIHTATGGAFDTGLVDPGTSSAPITMSTAGTFPYRCLLHPGMMGTLRVSP
jgi:PKD repeat protein